MIAAGTRGASEVMKMWIQQRGETERKRISLETIDRMTNQCCKLSNDAGHVLNVQANGEKGELKITPTPLKTKPSPQQPSVN